MGLRVNRISDFTFLGKQIVPV